MFDSIKGRVKKILLSIVRFLGVYKKLRFRTNLLIIFGVYTAMFLFTLLIFGYNNSVNIRNDKIQEFINLNIMKLKLILINFDENNGWVSSELENSLKINLNEGNYTILSIDGSVIYTQGATEDFINSIRNYFLTKMDSASGYIKILNTDNNPRYLFYNKTANSRYVLVYNITSHELEQYSIFSINSYVYSSVVCLILIILTAIYFLNRVYKPIVDVEKKIKGIVEGNTDLKPVIRKNSIANPIYTDLDIMTDKLKDLISREYTANVMKKQAELSALQSQINPHFLYNTLESIRGHAIEIDAYDIEIMTEALAEMFRYSISKRGDFVTLEDELENIDNYLMIQQYRFDNKFIIVKNIDKDTLKNKVPKLIIQPIVENAIHHGLETKVGKGTLLIEAYKTENRLIIKIKDDGHGMSYEKLKQMNEALSKGVVETEKEEGGTSIGLINVNERIKLNYGLEYGINIFSSLGIGTYVELVVPIMEANHSKNNF
jgi:sensor histidine kinase YesM